VPCWLTRKRAPPCENTERRSWFARRSTRVVVEYSSSSSMALPCRACNRDADVGTRTYALFLAAADASTISPPIDLSGGLGPTAHASYSNSYDRRRVVPQQNCISVGVANGVRGGVIGGAFGAVQAAFAGSAGGFASVRAK
jgi:hypothetical protein